MLSSEFSGSSPSWMPRGACHGQDPEIFFPINATGPALAQVIAAKAVCFRCAVRAACLSYAMATGQAGIWGGAAPRRNATPCGGHRPSLPASIAPRRALHALPSFPPGSNPCTPKDSIQAGGPPITIVTGAVATACATGAGCLGQPL
jgi:WhiB family redox-sensing transcriptional regulator